MAPARSSIAVGGRRRLPTETIVEGALHLVVRDEDIDGVAELLADALVAALEVEDRDGRISGVMTPEMEAAGAGR
jgi:predicted PilT family ATPase